MRRTRSVTRRTVGALLLLLLPAPAGAVMTYSGGAGVSTRLVAPNQTPVEGLAFTNNAPASAARTLRVTTGLHPGGDLLIDTAATTLGLAPSGQCTDVPAGTCPTDRAATKKPLELCVPSTLAEP